MFKSLCAIITQFPFIMATKVELELPRFTLYFNCIFINYLFFFILFVFYIKWDEFDVYRAQLEILNGKPHHSTQ